MTSPPPQKPEIQREPSDQASRPAVEQYAAGKPQDITGIGTQYTLPGVFPGLIGIQQTQQLQLWQGQFPPPDAVERYEAIQPGAFNRLIVMAEAQQQAQINQAKQANVYFQADVRRGHWLGAGVSIVSMGCALVALGMGSAIVAGLFLSVPVMAVGKALIDSSRPSQPKK